MNNKKEIIKYIKTYTYHGEYKDKYTDFRIVPNGWKILLDEILSELIKKEFDLDYKGEFIWAGEWKDHRRKVIKVFQINNEYATFEWGWCYDFIPKITKENIFNCRTDKSIYLHMSELSPDFCNNTKKRQNTIIEAHGEDINNVELSIEKMKKESLEVFKFLLPRIKEYFKKTQNYKGTLEDVIEKNNDNYYKMIKPNMIYTQVFLEFYLGLRKKAMREFMELSFEKDEVRNKVLKKIQGVPLDGYTKLK